MAGGVVSRIRREGNSVSVVLPKGVREALGLLPGDVVVFRLIGRKAVMAKFDVKLALPLSDSEASAAMTQGAPERVR